MESEKANKLILKPNSYHENEEDKKKFDKLTDVLMSFYLFPYFDPLEAKEMGKINSKFYNTFVRYYDIMYDKQIQKNHIDIQKDKVINQRNIYEIKEDKGHFIKLKLAQMEHYLLFSYFTWSWKDDTSYWEKITCQNSILNKEVFHLSSVCWVDVNAKMSHVYSGDYKLYLNHCVCSLRKDSLKLVIEKDGIVCLETDYPTKAQRDNCRHAHGDDDNNLYKQYITDINIGYNEDLDKAGGHEIVVKFNHKDLSWKSEWSIDAVILEQK